MPRIRLSDETTSPDWIRTAEINSEYSSGFTVPESSLLQSAEHRIAERHEKIVGMLGTLAKHSNNDLITSDTYNTMEANTVTMWFWKYASEQYSESTIEELIAGDRYDDISGTDAIRHHILSSNSQSIESEIERGYSPTDAFNSVTSDWPLKARAWMARYENSETDHGSESYQQDTENFAMTEGIGSYNPEQTTLDFYGGDNPFDLGELSHNEAVTACLVAAKYDGDDTAEKVDEVLEQAEHHDTLRDWLYRSDSIDKAIRAHYYDGMLPEGLIEELSPPDEWEMLEPTEVEQVECHRCNDEYYHVNHHDEGKTWLSENGSAGSMSRINQDEGTFFWYGSSIPTEDESALCEACRHEWSGNTNTVAVLTESGDRLSAEYNHGIAKDLGVSGDADAVARSDVDEETREFFINAISRQPPGNIEVSPNDAVADPDLQREALDSLVTGEEDVPDIGDFVTIVKSTDLSGYRYYAYFPADDPQTGAALKKLLEEPEQVSGVGA